MNRNRVENVVRVRALRLLCGVLVVKGLRMHVAADLHALVTLCLLAMQSWCFNNLVCIAVVRRQYQSKQLFSTPSHTCNNQRRPSLALVVFYLQLSKIAFDSSSRVGKEHAAGAAAPLLQGGRGAGLAGIGTDYL